MSAILKSVDLSSGAADVPVVLTEAQNLAKNPAKNPAQDPVQDGRRPRRARQAGPAAGTAARGKRAVSALVMRVLPPLLGLALVVLLWQIITIKNSAFPSPLVTLQEA